MCSCFRRCERTSNPCSPKPALSPSFPMPLLILPIIYTLPADTSCDRTRPQASCPLGSRCLPAPGAPSTSWVLWARSSGRVLSAPGWPRLAGGRPGVGARGWRASGGQDVGHRMRMSESWDPHRGLPTSQALRGRCSGLRPRPAGLLDAKPPGTQNPAPPHAERAGPAARGKRGTRPGHGARTPPQALPGHRASHPKSGTSPQHSHPTGEPPT